MRYLNLFGKITGVDTRYCFKYNSYIVFSIPRHFVSKAIGEGGRNVREMNRILGRKIKIIPHPEKKEDMGDFIAGIITPVTFKNLEIKNNEIILTAGNQNKAALIGRNKARILEMQKIIKDFFGMEFRIV